jgi:hypothetical protein
MRRGAWAVACAVVAFAMLDAGRAHAELRRFAVLVGNNVGSGARPPLRFAHEDVSRFAAVLREFGSIQRADLRTIVGGTPADLRAELRSVRARIEAWQTAPDRQTEILFYFSGHSDGSALEMGPGKISWPEVRALLEGTGANVRLAIVDTCDAGRLLRAKGGTITPPFDVPLPVGNQPNDGEAYLTSSAAGELALESAEIGGSFFTHHLASGMRGPADSSGDGNVTLAEAYQYAFGRTVTATATTGIGPQHPERMINIHGRGDVVLTRLQNPSATIEMPPGFDRFLLEEVTHREVVAELGPWASRRIAVPPGRYRMIAWRAQTAYSAETTVAQGQVSRVGKDAFISVGAPLLLPAKGEVGRAQRFEVSVGVGVEGAVAAPLPVLAGVRIGLGGTGAWRPVLVLDLASGRTADFVEGRGELLGGYQRRWRAQRWTFAIGAELGGGVALQHAQSVGDRTSGVVTGGGTATLGFSVTPSLTLALDGQSPVRFVRREGSTVALYQPAAWMTAAVAF